MDVPINWGCSGAGCGEGVWVGVGETYQYPGGGAGSRVQLLNQLPRDIIVTNYMLF